MNQNFVTRTFLEENRVQKRFQIESDLREFITSNLSENTVFWDIGACVGNFSIFAAHTGSRVLSFEPDGLTYSSLIANIYNSKLDNVSAFPIALGSNDKISDFYMKKFEIANAYNTVGNLIGPDGDIFHQRILRI